MDNASMTRRFWRERCRSMVMRIFSVVAGTLIAVFAVLVIVEMSYRLGWPDPHGAELEAFNPELVTGPGTGPHCWPWATASLLGLRVGRLLSNQHLGGVGGSLTPVSVGQRSPTRG